MPIYLGIDPGFDGGVASINAHGEVTLEPTPSTKGSPREYLEQQMVAIIGSGFNTFAAVEEQRAMPKQGGTSMFKIGVGYGLWRGILAARGVSYMTVRPQEWKRIVGLPAKADKGASVALAQRLFPVVADQLVGPKGGLRDGLAEALLIAEYRRRLGV